MLIMETPNLILRDFTNTDLTGYINLRADEKFKRFYDELDVTRSKSKSLLLQFISDSSISPRTNYQLAITKKCGTLIGSCGIRVKDNNSASVGCELGRHYQATGFAFEASSHIIKYAFYTLRIARVYAETISENKAALKLCKKLGMTLEQERLKDRFFRGRWWNTAVLGISMSEQTQSTVNN